MPPVSQISKGVFIVPADKVDVFKDTAAGGYVSAFTKARGDQWELSLKEAASQVANAEARYKLQMQALNDRIMQLEKMKADALQDLQKGEIDARQFKAKQDLEIATANAKLKLQARETSAKLVYPDLGGTKTTTVDGGGASRANTARSKLSADQQREVDDATTEPSVPAAIQSYENKVRNTLITGGATSQNALIDGLISKRVVDQGISRDDAKQQVLDEVRAKSPGMVTDYESTETAAAAGPKITKVEDVKLKLARPASAGVKAPTVELPSSIAAAAEPIEKPEDVAKMYDDKIAELQSQFPDAPASDLIYTARRLVEKNFGPTRGTPSAFDQRRTLDALLRATPAQREGLLKRFEAAQPPAPAPEQKKQTSEKIAPVASGGPTNASTAAAPVTPPSPISEASAGQEEARAAANRLFLDRIAANQARLMDDRRQIIDRSTPIGMPPAAQIPDDATVAFLAEEGKGDLASLAPTVASVINAENLARQAHTTFGPLERQRLTSFSAGTPDTTFLPPEPTAPAQVPETAQPAPIPPAAAKPAVQQPLNYLQTTVEARKERDAALPPAVVERDKQVGFMQSVINDANALIEDDKKFKAAGAGDVEQAATRVFKANAGKDVLKKSYAELNLLYNEDPDRLRKALTYMIALRLKQEKSKKMPTGE